MSLSTSKLARGIMDLGVNFPKDPYEAGKRWAHAYALFAADGTASGNPPASLAANERVLATALGSLWSSCRDAGTDAQGIASALTTFWLSPPVTFGPGAVTGVTGTSALASALPGIWSSNQRGRQSSESCAQKVAAAIKTFTNTVLVLLPGPSTVPVT